MRSSSGYTLISGDTETELSIEVYYGMQQMNMDNSETKFYYVWKQDGVALSNIEVKHFIENSDPLESEKIQNNLFFSVRENGFANEDFFKQKRIHITAADFDKKSDYRCDVFTTKEDALAEYKLLNKNGAEDIDLEFEKKE